MAMHSEESATCAELDARVVGHKSQLWQWVEVKLNDRFLPDGTDRKVHADLVYNIHPLFHQGDEAICKVYQVWEPWEQAQQSEWSTATNLALCSM